MYLIDEKYSISGYQPYFLYSQPNPFNSPYPYPHPYGPPGGPFPYMKPPGPGLDHVVQPHHAGQPREDPSQHPDKQSVKVNIIKMI